MKNKSFDQVFQLGMVAVKVIVLFLLVMVSLLLGVLWYQSESEINFLNNFAVEPMVETVEVEEGPADATLELETLSEEGDQEVLSFSSDRRVATVLVSVDAATQTLVVEGLNNTPVTVSYNDQTVFIAVSPTTDLPVEIPATDLVAQNSLLITATQESVSDLENIVLEKVMVSEE